MAYGPAGVVFSWPRQSGSPLRPTSTDANAQGTTDGASQAGRPAHAASEMPVPAAMLVFVGLASGGTAVTASHRPLRA